MKLKTIFEMPLVGYNADRANNNIRSGYGYDGYSKQSANALQHPKVIRKLSEVLSRHDYNIIIIADPAIGSSSLSDPIDLDTDYYEQLGISKNVVENAITVIINHDNSNNQQQLSPWMILHQVGEAATNGGMTSGWFNILKKYKKYFNSISGAFANNKWSKMYSGNDPVTDIFSHVFKMKSAREFIHGGFDNFDCDAELVTEYLWHGKIRINNVDGVPNEVISAIKNEAEDFAKNCLDRMIGGAYSNMVDV